MYLFFSDSGSRGCCDYVLTVLSILLFICTLPLSLFFTLKVRSQNEKPSDPVNSRLPCMTLIDKMLRIFFSTKFYSVLISYLFLTKKNQIVQEYERAVIFRLGRLLPGGAKGPGTDDDNATIYNLS